MISLWRSACGSKFPRRRICRSRDSAALSERLFESAADGHHFAHGLHLCAEHRLRAGEFFELPAWDFDDDIIDGRFESRPASARVMSFLISSSRYPTASLAAIFAIGKPVAFEASAELRETRGFISTMTMRPFSD